jgi:hypothetical protein
MIARIAGASVLALVNATPACNVAAASSAYDGSWSLPINTQRGACDPTYYFQVQISNGHVSSPGLNKFRGHVSSGGRVQVSVSAGGKYAAGSGRLSRTAGSGRWSGHSGRDRCSGTWTAQRY